jgi:hypothetical protein
MDGFIDSSLMAVMKIDDKDRPLVKKSERKAVDGVKKNIDPKTNQFIFKRTPAGERVRTLVEMKGDEIIRHGVDAAYNYLNNKRSDITSKNVEDIPSLPTQRKSLFSVLWPFIVGVGITLFFVNEMIPGGLGSLF